MKKKDFGNLQKENISSYFFFQNGCWEELSE